MDAIGDEQLRSEPVENAANCLDSELTSVHSLVKMEVEVTDLPKTMVKDPTKAELDSSGAPQSEDGPSVLPQQEEMFADLFHEGHSEEQDGYEPADYNVDDLDQLFVALHNEDTELDDLSEPPTLFNRPEHVPSYKTISKLKYQVSDQPIAGYLTEFESKVKDDVLMIENVSLDAIQAEERRLRDEYIAYQMQELEMQKAKRLHLTKTERNAKRHLTYAVREKRQILSRLVQLAAKKERLQRNFLQIAFSRSLMQLSSVLSWRKAEVKAMFGKLVGYDFGGKGRKSKLDWDKVPQPIQIKLRSLRGVKDKIPAGQYILMVSLYNRLGGHVMRWSSVKGQDWGGTTSPLVHSGKFNGYELKVNQSVFTVLPSKPSVRPGMCLIFELFLLGGPVLRNDRMVSWGSFPICDGSFEIIEGTYKTPMLRGETDATVDKYSSIEQVIASDLDHWMCNLYFEIVRLPRYIGNQKEFEVELQFTSGFLNHPDRVNLDGEEYRDSENPVQGSVAGSITHLPSANDVESAAPSEYDETKSEHSLKMTWDGNSEVTQTTDLRKKTTPSAEIVIVKKGRGDSSYSDDEAEDENEPLLLSKTGFRPVAEERGLYVKEHLDNPVDVYTKRLYATAPRGNALVNKMQKRKLTYAEQLEQHTASVKPPFSEKGRLSEKGWKRVSYVSRQFLSELGLSQWRSREFWGMLMTFIMTFFLRIFLHYCGQWIFLKACSIPINSFDFTPYTVKLNYQPSLLGPADEMAVVLLGPITVLIFFLLCVLLSWLCQSAMGMFPDLGSKFVLSIGIQSFMDPVFILVVDLIIGNYDYNYLTSGTPIADSSKMYWHFTRTQGSGIAGIVVTLFIYLFTMFASGAILYMYFLRLHNNGRMLDIYWRLHATEQQIFTPHDLEISLQELDYHCRKAEEWRGQEGERRKVAVYDYVWEEEDAGTGLLKETTTHIAIHTIHMDGLKELHRHFLVLPGGAIVEMFGEMSYVPGLHKDLKKALNHSTRKVEDLFTLPLSPERMDNVEHSTDVQRGNANVDGSAELIKQRQHGFWKNELKKTL